MVSPPHPHFLTPPGPPGTPLRGAEHLLAQAGRQLARNHGGTDRNHGAVMRPGNVETPAGKRVTPGSAGGL